MRKSTRDAITVKVASNSKRTDAVCHALHVCQDLYKVDVLAKEAKT